jgi:hypothetical protein
MTPQGEKGMAAFGGFFVEKVRGAINSERLIRAAG